MKLSNIISVTAIVAGVGLLAPAGFAGSAGDDSGRSGSEAGQRTESPSTQRGNDESTAPRSRETSAIDFDSVSATGGSRDNVSSPQSVTYNPRVNRLRPVDNPKERFPQPDSLHERPIVWIDKSEETSSSGGSGQDEDLESLLERDEVLVDEPGRNRVDDGNRIVFCNRKLLEMHIRRNCEMLGDVTPTPVPLRSAREARYAPCTVCYKPR